MGLCVVIIEYSLTMNTITHCFDYSKGHSSGGVGHKNQTLELVNESLLVVLETKFKHTQNQARWNTDFLRAANGV